MKKRQFSQKWVVSWMTLLFFIWGFLTEMDGALIPFLKDLFELSNFQAALVQFAFFLAFFLFSFPSAKLLDALGYRKGIALGLAIMACGSFGFIAAGYFGMYLWFLLAIFLLAGGVTLLQVAANPYMVALGGDEKGSNYLNIAQGFNAGAKVLAPLFGAWAILKGMESLSSEARIDRISWVYLGIGFVLSVAALLYKWVRLPEIIPTENHLDTIDTSNTYRDFPHLLKGALAIFCYVGIEVSVATFLVLYLGEFQGLSRADGAVYLSYYWAALMIGRLLIPTIMPKVAAQKVLLWFALAASICMLCAGLGLWFGAWALVACGFFHSIMWGNIFALSLRKLGTFTSKGSGLLVMAIVGGALLPPFQGFIADQIGLIPSYLSLIPAYFYLIWFAWKGFQPRISPT